jgi:ABC-type bacteriocin/lantibiotic exporter with double-glycine peptidase domain
MHFLMNITHNFAKVIVLGVGGWYVIDGKTEVGTLVAFVSALNNVHDPSGALVNWYKDMMVTRTRYQTFVAAMERFAKDEKSRSPWSESETPTHSTVEIPRPAESSTAGMTDPAAGVDRSVTS